MSHEEIYLNTAKLNIVYNVCLFIIYFFYLFVKPNQFVLMLFFFFTYDSPVKTQRTSLKKC